MTRLFSFSSRRHPVFSFPSFSDAVPTSFPHIERDDKMMAVRLLHNLSTFGLWEVREIRRTKLFAFDSYPALLFTWRW